MKIQSTTAYLMLPILVACGGSNSPLENQTIQDTEQAMTGTNPTAGIYQNPLPLTSTQLAGVYSFASDTLAVFNDYNRRPIVMPNDNAAAYGGTMIAQIGAGEQYLSGSFEVTLDMISGTGRGRIAGIAMSGAATENMLMDFGASLEVNVTSIESTKLNGTISGEFSDVFAFDPQFSEEFVVDATFDIHFIDSGSFTGMVGILGGTINGETDGINLLNGVIETEHAIFGL